MHDSNYVIKGYSIELRHRTRQGGGVCIYVRDDIPYIRASKVESKVLEHISIDMTVKGRKINLKVLYRPPSRTTPEQTAQQEDAKFLDNIEITLAKIRSHRAATKLVCGWRYELWELLQLLWGTQFQKS